MSAERVEYKAVWPTMGLHIAINPSTDKTAFFETFDNLINSLDSLGVPKRLRPAVHVRALEWTPWVSFGDARRKGWVPDE